MENSANALKIAFACIILVLAITITFLLISQAKETADTVFFVSDETNYYDMSSIGTGAREVDIDTVISTLYRLYDESLCVIIDNGGSKTIYNSSKYVTSKDAYKDIASIASSLSGTYTETFQEIKTSGIYEYASDGSELAITPGGTKMYITYTKVST